MSSRFSGTGVFAFTALCSGAFTGDHVFFGDHTLESDVAGAVVGGGGGGGTGACNRVIHITCQPTQLPGLQYLLLKLQSRRNPRKDVCCILRVSTMWSLYNAKSTKTTDQGPYTSGRLKFKAIQDFSRLFEKEIQDYFINISMICDMF